MSLTVAVQMDPIERIRIAGDSTFALLLEAQARGHRLLHYTPDRLRLNGKRLEAMAEPLSVKDVEGGHAHLGEAKLVDLATVDVVLLRQDPPFDLAYVTTTHLLERVQPKTLVVNDPRGGARRAGEAVRDGLSPFDAANPDRPRSGGDRGISRRTRRSGDEAAVRFRRGGGVQGRGQGPELRFAVRSLHGHPARAVGDPEVPAGGRQGDKRILLVDGEPKGAVNRVPASDDIRSNMVRGGAAKETDLTVRGTRDMRGDRPGTQAARVFCSSAST